jgi:hypothetical protein
LINTRPGEKAKSVTEDIDVYTSKLYDLNIHAQDAVRDFALHDIDDMEGVEKKRIAMHDAFTDLYNEIATFSEEIRGEDFDIAYLRERIEYAEEDAKEQLEIALKEPPREDKERFKASC